MEQLIGRYDIVIRALDALNIAFQKLQERTCRVSEEDYRTLRDSEIKRFEISVDTLWKYLKHYLEMQHGIIQSSPKSVFRECLRTRILQSAEDVALALKMVDARNITSHVYKEEVAEQIHDSIGLYYHLMRRIVEAAKPHKQQG